MAVVWTALSVVLFFAALVAHETGHLIAMQRSGVAVAEFGLGLALWPRVVLQPRGRRTFRLSLSPWLVMAYVKPANPKALDALPYPEGAWCEGAGVVANLVAGLALFSLASVLGGRWLYAVMFAAAAVIFTVVRRYAARLLIPVMGAAAVVFVAWVDAAALAHHQATGPAGVVVMLRTASFSFTVVTAAAINVSLAVINSLPFMPLDGGRIARRLVDKALGERVGEVFMIVGTGAFALLCLVSIVGDVLHFA